MDYPIIKSMNRRKPPGFWPREFSPGGRVERAVRWKTSAQSLASSLGVTVAALKRAWGRHGTGSMEDALGMNSQANSPDAESLEELLRDRALKLPAENARASIGRHQAVIFEPVPGERALMTGDIHFGVANQYALELMVRCAIDFNVGRVIQPGDSYDCYGISRHGKHAARINSGGLSLAGEREAGRWFQNWVAETSRESGLESYLIPGNHEERLEAIQDLNPGLDGTLSIKRVFDIPDEIRVLEPRSKLRAGSLVIEHGHQIPGSLSKYGASRALARFPDQTTLFGHTHRIMSARHTTYDIHGEPRTRMAASVGHLSNWRAHAHYAPAPNWQQGFALIEFGESAQGEVRFKVHLVEIHSDGFIFNGVHYR